jgi:hypothetical protein
MSLNKIGNKYLNKLHWEYVMEYCSDIDFILDYMPEEFRKYMLPLYNNRNASIQEYLTKHPLPFYTEIVLEDNISYDQQFIDNMIEFLSTSHHPHAIHILQKLLREKREVYEEKYRQECTWFSYVVANLNENPYFTDVLFDEFPDWIKVDYLSHNTNSRAVQYIISLIQLPWYRLERGFTNLRCLHEFSANTNKEAIAFLRVRENHQFLSWRIMSTNSANEAIQLLKENESNIDWFCLHSNENPTAIEWLENNPIQLRIHLLDRNHCKEAYALMYRVMDGNTIKSVDIHMNPYACKEIQTRLEYSDFKHGKIHDELFGPLSKNPNVHLIFQEEDLKKTENYILDMVGNR